MAPARRRHGHDAASGSDVTAQLAVDEQHPGRGLETGQRQAQRRNGASVRVRIVRTLWAKPTLARRASTFTAATPAA